MPSPMDAALAVAGRQLGLLTAEQALRSGLSRDDVIDEARAGRWLALYRGVYLLDPDRYAAGLRPEVWWRAALLAEGPGSLLMGATAVRALGVQGLPATESHLELGTVGGLSRHRRSSCLASDMSLAEGPPIVMRQIVVPPEGVRKVGGWPVREPAAALVDAALRADRATALAVLDSALYQRVTSRSALDEAVAGAAGRRGARALRVVAALADERAQSPGESRVRLACIDQLVPPDALQYPLRTPAGVAFAYGDLAWTAKRRRPLIGEVDGVSVHSAPIALYRDRYRANSVVAEACDMIRFTYRDAFRPAYIGHVVRQALAANA